MDYTFQGANVSKMKFPAVLQFCQPLPLSRRSSFSGAGGKTEHSQRKSSCLCIVWYHVVIAHANIGIMSEGRCQDMNISTNLITPLCLHFLFQKACEPVALRFFFVEPLLQHQWKCFAPRVQNTRVQSDYILHEGLASTLSVRESTTCTFDSYESPSGSTRDREEGVLTVTA